MKGWGRDTEDPSSSIPPEKWEQHFKGLLNSPKYKPFKIPERPRHSNDTADTISEKELQAALSKAKSGKACGQDEIPIEFIKHATGNVTKSLLDLMNVIFSNAIYPSQWTVNFLKPIYKKGPKDDPDNYRGLAIGSSFGKLYSLILLQRLEIFTDERKTLNRNQIADHIFLLKTLVTKITKQNNKRLYAAFIDFKKAYDTVNRSTLLERLSSIGVGHSLLLNIQALYKKTEYTIKTKDATLKAISSNLGLKQGCPLSPLLFNIYINDIANYLDDTPENSSIQLQGTTITHFLYADDLVILSDFKKGLQRKLDKMTKFEEDKDLAVNIKKTKVMIFNKKGGLIKDIFKINNSEIEVVKTFTYLGINITASGSFTATV